MADSGWVGAERGTRAFIPVMAQAMHDQNLVGMQARRLDIAQQQANTLEENRLQQAALYREQIKAMEMKNAIAEEGEKYVNAREGLARNGITEPELQDYFIDKASKKGYIEIDENGIPTIKKKHGVGILAESEKDPKSGIDTMSIQKKIVLRKQSELDLKLGKEDAIKKLPVEEQENARKEVQKLKEKNPEVYQALEKERELLVNQYDAAHNHQARYQREFDAKTSKAEKKTEYPYAGTGGVVFSKETGKPTYVKPFKETGGVEKDEKKSLSDDYTHIRQAYTDIVKNSDDKQLVEAAQKGLRYLPGIRGNRAKLDEAMNWLADPYNPQASAPAKTVTIDGKQYKDGDIYTKGGKQFTVKVKK